jgi:hypothetical protein
MRIQGSCGETCGKERFGRSKRRWQDNIKKNIKEIIWGGIDWIHEDRDVDMWWAPMNTAINFRIA